MVILIDSNIQFSITAYFRVPDPGSPWDTETKRLFRRGSNSDTDGRQEHGKLWLPKVGLEDFSAPTA